MVKNSLLFLVMLSLGSNASSLSERKKLASTDLSAPIFFAKDSQAIFQARSAPNQKLRFVILVSDALGNNKLTQLMTELSYREDVVFVFQGMLKHEKTLGEAIKRIALLTKDLTPMPNVNLDPRPFEEVSANLAPAILAYQGEKLIAFATGIANPVWLKAQIEQGNTGFLGSFGDSVAISEKNLSEIIKQRLARLEPNKLIARAKKNYWQQISFVALPRANQTKIRRITPELRINKPIYGSKGQPLILAGTRVNTLEQLPFTQRLIIFDATNESELEFVKNKLLQKNLRTKLITTKLDRNLDWNALNSVEQLLDNSVYLLNQAIVNAFDLKATPSIVIADNQKKEFVIFEYQL